MGSMISTCLSLLRVRQSSSRSKRGLSTFQSIREVLIVVDPHVPAGLPQLRRFFHRKLPIWTRGCACESADFPEWTTLHNTQDQSVVTPNKGGEMLLRESLAPPNDVFGEHTLPKSLCSGRYRQLSISVQYSSLKPHGRATQSPPHADCNREFGV